ncbi:UDP-N-acetylglucosamine 2-epimerase [Fulvivirga imtechensis AK7]|uniref:UDP-N-acetylglucosamine 2-epimerase n=1 Tax=Fulvivirga imtechensis AK7 TaxID=1237149 RepID=L8JQW0_9BACT|nr:UDP-N-acetylglucosamine 2-epimerase [Fulvivirga imtechensis AK7]
MKALKEHKECQLSVIAFGTHLSPFHGHTVNQILEDGFSVDYRINSLLINDDANSISTAVALTSLKFAEFWQNHAQDFDAVFCLGDRYEMFAAVTSGIPYGIKFAHLHGGETTLGAIDNIYRHAISLASHWHFTAHDSFSERIAQIIGSRDRVITVGALGLDNLENLCLLSKEEFFKKWNIDINIPSILITVHPETVDIKHMEQRNDALINALNQLVKKYQLIITMPNADTFGTELRRRILTFREKYVNELKLVENFGTQSYFTCMKYSSFLLGNTSSGIIEAASFQKYVINLGDRQKGRMSGDNVVHVPFGEKLILNAVGQIEKKQQYEGGNIYYQGGAVKKILKEIFR